MLTHTGLEHIHYIKVNMGCIRNLFDFRNVMQCLGNSLNEKNMIGGT